MAYFTLLTRFDDRRTWGIEFGDHDRGTVQTERDYYRDQGHKAADLKIVKTRTARQREIDAAVAALNAEEC